MGYINKEYWSSLHQKLPGKLSAVGYEGLGEGFNRATYGIRLQAAEALLRSHPVRPVTTVIEGAVGVGKYREVWQALGMTAWVGLDISEAAIGHLQERFPDSTFLRTDLTDANDPAWTHVPLQADLVTAVDVLYHLTDDALFATALKNLASRVRKSGWLLVSDIFVPERKQTAEHVVRRPLDAYLRVLDPLGFEVKGRAAVFSILGDPVQSSAHPFRDRLLRTGWRALSKAIRLTPLAYREPTGAMLVRAVEPMDALFKRLGWAKGFNLELCLLQRR